MEEFNLKLEVLEVYTGFDRNMMVGVFKLTVMLLDSHSHHWSHHDVFLIWVFDDDLFSDRLTPGESLEWFSWLKNCSSMSKGPPYCPWVPQQGFCVLFDIGLPMT